MNVDNIQQSNANKSNDLPQIRSSLEARLELEQRTKKVNERKSNRNTTATAEKSQVQPRIQLYSHKLSALNINYMNPKLGLSSHHGDLSLEDALKAQYIITQMLMPDDKIIDASMPQKGLDATNSATTRLDFATGECKCVNLNILEKIREKAAANELNNNKVLRDKIHPKISIQKQEGVGLHISSNTQEENRLEDGEIDQIDLASSEDDNDDHDDHIEDEDEDNDVIMQNNQSSKPKTGNTNNSNSNNKDNNNNKYVNDPDFTVKCQILRQAYPHLPEGGMAAMAAKLNLGQCVDVLTQATIARAKVEVFTKSPEFNAVEYDNETFSPLDSERMDLLIKNIHQQEYKIQLNLNQNILN